MSTIDIKPSPVMDFRQVSREIFFYSIFRCFITKFTFIFGWYDGIPSDDCTVKKN